MKGFGGPQEWDRGGGLGTGSPPYGAGPRLLRAQAKRGGGEGSALRVRPEPGHRGLLAYSRRSFGLNRLSEKAVSTPGTMCPVGQEPGCVRETWDVTCTHLPVSVPGTVSSARPSISILPGGAAALAGRPTPTPSAQWEQKGSSTLGRPGSLPLLPVAALPPKYSCGTRTYMK